MADDFTVKVENLAQFRRDLRQLDKTVNRELTRSLRGAAEIVAARASALAPRKTGTLAASYRGGAAGTRGYVRSRVPYAPVIEYGGSVGRGHSSTRPGATYIRAQAPVRRALEARQDEVVDAVGDAIERAARDAGWH